MKANDTILNDFINTDILKEGKQKEFFVGRPFSLSYENASVLICDDDKMNVKGIAQGTFLLAFYDNEEIVEEAILLRALSPAKLPTDSANVSSMIEYYKDNLPTTGEASKLDDFTKYEFSFSGLECRILGTFYRKDGKIEFGADLENFYSAHHYSVYKVNKNVLGFIVNQRDSPDIVPGNPNEFDFGYVRYSSSRRFQNKEESARVYMNPSDLLGKRTALFGMTRTGKSNTVKKVIEATVQISSKSQDKLENFNGDIEANLKPIHKSGAPIYPVGQIIFDVNGEYANPNMQDNGTAIYDMFNNDDFVTRYSVVDKKGFKVMKINFYEEIENAFDLINSYFIASGISTGYINNFLSIDLSVPNDFDGFNSSSVRHNRRVAAYKCCLYKAGYPIQENTILSFKGNPAINSKMMTNKVLDPSKGINFDDACTWFEWVWENYDSDNFFLEKKQKEGKEWADEDLKSLLVMLSGFRSPNKRNKVYGFKSLGNRDLLMLHTEKTNNSFETDIRDLLRQGKIVIVDLSQGNPAVQATFSEKICRKLFSDSMKNFTKTKPNNFVQFYFEEAHNLFPKKDDSDLSQIYNRIAKEGAKLNLGMIYATQEVSSISSNILKNTQNWFIAHLNNDDEIRELKKYYDFKDFTESLTRFSAKEDKGFVRMKTYSNPFVVPVQIDKFEVK